MTFAEMTRVMLSSMDFFELRRTAARYGVPFQGVRRSKLLRDLERKITMKDAVTPANEGAGDEIDVIEEEVSVEISVSETVVAAKPRAAGRKGSAAHGNKA